MSLRGTREVSEKYQVFDLIGQLDAFSEPTFQKVILNCIKSGPNRIILDLSQIDFIDSSGLGALVRIAKTLKEGKGKLQIVTNARVTQTVKMVRLEKFLELQPDLVTALTNIKAT